MKFSLNFCAIEIIALCFMIPAILMSSYENREFDNEFDGWWKIIGEFCVEFGCRLISSISGYVGSVLFLTIALAIWSDVKGLKKLLLGVPIVIGIATVLGEINP
jgi:hypothetical protein